jgi:eukaryotic-like serine/threonine-protein kinase
VDAERIGPYLVDRRLGSGGMGTVVRAWDERLRRWVAIKSVHPDQVGSAERRVRLQREARALAGLNHPAVAQVFDVIVDGGRDHIVMEYVQGRSLAAMLVDGPLPVEQAIQIARQVAEGLAAAHARGAIHRDLKAENILVTAAGQAKILDFGLVKHVDADSGEDSLTEDGVVMGTTRAMSPEQAEGRELDPRSDLFALGSLLYELTTGAHPFQASSPLETMQRVVAYRPPPITRRDPGLPRRLEQLVQRLLDKDPGRRPATAAEVATALGSLLAELDAGGPAAAPPSRRGTRWRLPVLVALLVILLVTLLITLP